MKPLSPKEIAKIRAQVEELTETVPGHVLIAMTASTMGWHVIVSSDDDNSSVHGMVIGVPAFIDQYMKGFAENDEAKHKHKEEANNDKIHDHRDPADLGALGTDIHHGSGAGCHAGPDLGRTDDQDGRKLA